MKLSSVHGVSGTPPAAKEQQKLKGTCEEFEAILTNILFKSMRESIPKADPEGADHAMELYEGMLDDAVARQLSHGPGLGLGKMLYQQLSSQVKPRR
jgi:peptidoglycan hydrolase FlgJ